MAETIDLNKNWLFHYGDEPGADYMGWDDRAWTSVTLPHDWAVTFPFSREHSSGTGYLPGGVGWYRRHFTLPEDIAGKRVRVTFGGVYKHARVWVNSNYLGGRAYGYSTFSFDISEFVRPGENVLAVRAEHSEVADSRWYTGSGIYRDVRLTVSGQNCFAENGVSVFTRELLLDGAALIDIGWKTLGCTGARFTVCAADGTSAAAGECAGESGSLCLTLPAAALWSPETPYLYRLRCEALSGDAAADTHDLSFGVRTARFDAEKGFFLNGENMKLRGVCVHHDAGALGAAVPPEVWRRRLYKLKAMGCNALRTAHNPPDPALLDLCDELGFLVMDEAFDEWEGAKNKWWHGHNVYPPKRFGYAEDFPFWHRRDLEDMILRDRNHPSVILWSIGNEIDYPNDPYVTPLFDEVLGNNDNGKPAQERKYDNKKPDAARLIKVAAELTDIAHRADPTRPVLAAMAFPELSTRTGFAEPLDVWGYNYKESFYARDHALYPSRVILGSENSHAPGAWRAVLENDYIAGQFLWTGVDFLGECRGWPERISGAGALDLCGFEKPVYYQRKALWTSEPFVKLAVSRGPREKTGMWSDAFVYSGASGVPVSVSCYTNQSAAELFLNGVSLGRKDAAADDFGRLTWELPFEPGVLTAVAGPARDELRTPGPAAALRLLPEAPSLHADGRSAMHVEVLLTDENGVPAASDDQTVYYQLAGDGEILGIENGKPDDLTPYASRCRATYRGRAIVYIRAGTLPGPLTLFAYTKSGLRAQAVLTEEQTDEE